MVADLDENVQSKIENLFLQEEKESDDGGDEDDSDTDPIESESEVSNSISRIDEEGTSQKPVEKKVKKDKSRRKMPKALK